MAVRALTAEQRVEMAMARKAAMAARGMSTLRSDFADEPHWHELARRYNIRLPQYGIPMTPAGMTRWLHKLGLTLTYYKKCRGWRGADSRQRFIAANPLWPLRAFVDLMLEAKAHDEWHAAGCPQEGTP